MFLAWPVSGLLKEFDIKEAETVLNYMKTDKAVGLVGMFLELLKHCGLRTVPLLFKFLFNVIQTDKLPLPIKRTKILAILKPGKDETKTKNRSCR